MKKILIIFTLLISVGVISTSGCGLTPATPKENITDDQAEKIALAHVKARMAELSTTLSGQVDKSWFGTTQWDGRSYIFPVHPPGVGSMAPDFEVYVDIYKGNVSDSLPANWVSTTKSYVE